MDEKLKAILVCPEQKKKLVFGKNQMQCGTNKYKIINGVPVFLSQTVSEDESFDSYGLKLKRSRLGFIKKVHPLIVPPKSSFLYTLKVSGQKVEAPLAKFIEKRGLTLNIGSSSKKVYPNTINLDIGLYENVDVVADGKNLPFKNNSFDVVVLESVLEHVDEAEKVISESYRVLKKGGVIYISIPFVFIFHGSPNDFNRYTLEGAKKRLEHAGFHVIESGIIAGPSSTINQALRYYLSILLCFNSDFLFSLWLNVFGWLTFWIKYLDFFLKNNKKAHILANVIYAVGKK